MRVNGYNVAAILVAAVAIYFVGFLIYGLMVDPMLWMKEYGISQDQMDAVGASRMPYSVLMPLATATGMAILFRFAGVDGLRKGLKVATMVALTSAIPTIWYGWVYGVASLTMPVIDSAHLFFGHLAAGAVLSLWK